MRLLGVELNRFVSRSAVQWLFVAGAILAASGALLALGSATPMPEAERKNAVDSFEQYHAQWLEESPAMYEACLEDEADAQTSDPGVSFECEWALEEPRLEDWLWEASFAEVGPDMVLGLVSGLQGLILLAAVTFVAAEFSTGALGNWLTFEPRRTRVYLSKLGAAVLGLAPFAAISYAVALGAVYAPFAYYGTTGDVDAQAWTDLATLGGRVVLAGALVAVIATALAFLVRHLAAAIGIAVGWLLVVEQLGSAAYPALQRWTLANNLRAVVEGGSSYYLDVCGLDPEGRRSCEWTELPISLTQGSLVLSGFAIVLTVVALVVFRRRDVT